MNYQNDPRVSPEIKTDRLVKIFRFRSRSTREPYHNGTNRPILNRGSMINSHSRWPHTNKHVFQVEEKLKKKCWPKLNLF